MSVFRLPDLGEGLSEAEILRWHVAVGDLVEIDQLVVEVETAKAAVEVPVPFAGTVLALHAPPGAVLAVGAPLISIGDPAGESTGSGNVLIGYGTTVAPGRSRRRARRSVAEPPRPPGQSAATPPDQRPVSPPAPRVISPLVRKLARDNGLDLAVVAASGPGAIVLRRDVERAIALPPSSTVEGVERIPLRGLRRAVADKLTRSRREIPDATTWVDVDATKLVEAVGVLRGAANGPRVGLTTLLARIVIVGLRRYPDLNCAVDVEAGEILRYQHVNLGFAAQTERGLMVPVVRRAERLTTAELATEITRLTELARSGAIAPEHLTGGTFTLNNYGVFGVDGSTPIINYPEAGLLGIGRIIDRPWVVDGALAVRKVGQLSLTFDHRVCDGGVAGGFLRFVADRVENPETLLLDL